jgi:hypothetical protein
MSTPFDIGPSWGRRLLLGGLLVVSSFVVLGTVVIFAILRLYDDITTLTWFVLIAFLLSVSGKLVIATRKYSSQKDPSGR